VSFGFFCASLVDIAMSATVRHIKGAR